VSDSYRDRLTSKTCAVLKHLSVTQRQACWPFYGLEDREIGVDYRHKQELFLLSR
jgi:hypothetical protein